MEERISRIEKALNGILEHLLSGLDGDKDYWTVKKLEEIQAELNGWNGEGQQDPNT